MGTRGKKGRYSKVSRELQLANQRARSRRYRAAKRQFIGQPMLMGGLYLAPSDTVDAAAANEPEGGDGAPNPDPTLSPDVAAETH